MIPQGLSYQPVAISPEVATEIYNELQTGTLSGNWANEILKNRRVQQYGYHYGYQNHKITRLADPIPQQFNTLMKVINDPAINQCIVNEYTSGQGISLHTDSFAFGPSIY